MKKILFFSVLLFSGMHVFALSPIPADKAGPFEMIQTGSWHQFPIYECRKSSGTAGSFWLIIKDKYGNQLHEERISQVSASPRFMFNMEELGTAVVVYEVYSDYGVLIQRSKLSL
jgi:hypothetical protein